MIKIDNKFDLGQEVYYITKIQHPNKGRIWDVKSKTPLKILCIYFKSKIKGGTDLLYNIHPYGKAREENLFLDYESAKAECMRRNELEKSECSWKTSN